jgi:sirohydrochlorin cobaltochelatase
LRYCSSPNVIASISAEEAASMKAIILFAHGARDPAWAEPLRQLQAAIRVLEPTARVELAFLELMRPTLNEAVDALADVGEIVIVPAFIAAGAHVKRDLPQQAAAAMERHPQLEIRIAPPIGDSPAVLAAIAEFALRQ